MPSTPTLNAYVQGMVVNAYYTRFRSRVPAGESGSGPGSGFNFRFSIFFHFASQKTVGIIDNQIINENGRHSCSALLQLSVKDIEFSASKCQLQSIVGVVVIWTHLI